MGRNLKKLAAAVLSAVLVLQSCNVVAFAAETQTEAQTLSNETAVTEAQTSEVQTAEATETAQTQSQATEAAQTEGQATETQGQSSETATEAQSQVSETATEAQTQTGETTTEEQSQAGETATEAQTQAGEAVTEAQSQSSESVTEGQSQSSESVTEAQTQASESESETQTKDTESETSETSKKKKKTDSESETETETETETERSSRVNAGAKLKADDLEKKLSEALPYLIVAEETTIPEKVTDALVAKLKAELLADTAEASESDVTGEEQESADDGTSTGAETEALQEETINEEELLGERILESAKSKKLLETLSKTALELADAQSTDEVTVINLYVDEDGKLDETQLLALFPDKVIDLTDSDTVYLINVIADSEDQEIEFSGYSMERSGKAVDYSDDSDEYQSGVVLYNFAAMDGDSYTSYKGVLKLSGDQQGTFLAPEAEVEIKDSLAGAVYAESVTVEKDSADLLLVVYLADEPEETEESETAGAENEINGEAETADEEESSREDTAESETGEDTVTTDGDKTADPEDVSEAESEDKSGDGATETEAESESETEASDEATAAATTAEDTIEGRSITVTAQALYENRVLSAMTDVTGYVALFTGTATNLTRVSDVAEITFAADEDVSEAVVFDRLDAGTYYVAATDAAGNLLTIADVQGDLLLDEEIQTEETEAQSAESVTEAQTEATEAQTGTAETEDILAADETDADKNLLTAGDGTLAATVVAVTLSENAAASGAAVLQYQYTTVWPADLFYYSVKLSITLNVKDRDGNALSGSEKFYMNIYSDAQMTTAVNDSPIKFSMGGESTKTKTYKLKVTAPQQTFYLGETDSSGALVTTGENGFAYIMSLEGANELVVTAADTSVSVTAENQLNDSTIRIRVEDSADGSLLSGATLAIKDSSGNIYEVETVGSKTFTSGTTEIVWTNALTDGETYYLTEITAPSGYTPVPDVAFTVARGCTTEVVLKNEATVATGYALTVTQEVYVGDYQVYAYDTTTGAYKAQGAYTYYVALFSDAARKNKVSDVVSLEVSGFTGNVTFLNLKANGVYYVAETDEYGVVLSSSDTLSVQYTNSGTVQMSETVRSVVAQTVYASLPGGYRYTGTLTLTMNVTNSSGSAEAVTNTFYVGIYRNADYSDTPTIVSMTLSNASTVSVRRRILLSGESDMTYYIAEVDASGNRITDSSDFNYVVTIDNPTVTITKGSDQTVTVTNKVKATKATLYLTMRVYDGTELMPVSETFYVGLFKDEAMTQLYANPIAMTLNNASELTLKLTLNLGTSSGVTVYIAEVDEDGNVISNQREFGYQIKIVNSVAAFTQDNLEIQTVILNSVYGTTSTDDWSSIYSSTSSDIFGESSYYYSVDDNGYVTGYANSVQTGDDTPILGWVVLMCAAFGVFAYGWESRRRRGAM